MKNKNRAQRVALAAGFLAVAGNRAMATSTDITGVMSDVTTYKDGAIVIGIAILLFVIGRKVVRKLI